MLLYSSQALIAQRLGMSVCRSASADGTSHMQRARGTDYLGFVTCTSLQRLALLSTAVRCEIEMHSHSGKYMQRTQPKNDGTIKANV